MFVAGLAIVRAHNRWRADWTVLVTLSGWLALTFGAARMFAASAYQQRATTIGLGGQLKSGHRSTRQNRPPQT
jgi:hypothetical protein